MQTHRQRGKDVLDKQDTLRLNDNEVDELVNITDKTINRFAGYCVVPTRAYLGGKTIVQDELADNLSCDG